MKVTLFSTSIATGVLTLIATLGFIIKGERADNKNEAVVRLGTIDSHISARGRVEGISEELKLGSKVPGRIKSILVEEGERIQKDQVLAVLENDEYKVTLEMQTAALKKAQAQLNLVTNGARPEERQDLGAAVEKARAEALNAQATYHRLKSLSDQGIVSKEQLDLAEMNAKSAEAVLESARLRYKLINASARDEDLQAARAEVAIATARVRQAEIDYQNTFIRSPINGIVLKKYMRQGESITFQSVSMPLLSIADNTRLLVRAEIDETDVNKVQPAQVAFATAEAYGTESFSGKVVRISGGMGKKEIKTDNPVEKVDMEVLEAIIELDPGAEAKLKLGLRVDVLIRITYKENVLLIPLRAVREELDVAYVRLKQNDSWLDQRIVVGARDYSHVEIKDGLQVNDIVRY